MGFKHVGDLVVHVNIVDGADGRPAAEWHSCTGTPTRHHCSYCVFMHSSLTLAVGDNCSVQEVVAHPDRVIRAHSGPYVNIYTNCAYTLAQASYLLLIQDPPDEPSGTPRNSRPAIPVAGAHHTNNGPTN
jgi:hypothetical protein